MFPFCFMHFLGIMSSGNFVRDFWKGTLSGLAPAALRASYIHNIVEQRSA